MKAYIDHEVLKSALHYSPETGIFTWLKKPNKRIPAGAIAGSKDVNGYWAIRLDGRLYLAHRLAWFYVHGKWPLEFIDHINRIRDDNRIQNLREAGYAENVQNTLVRSNNKVGLKGVSWNKRNKCWQAKIVHQGVQHYLGGYADPQQASMAYNDAAALMHKCNPNGAMK